MYTFEAWNGGIKVNIQCQLNLQISLRILS